MSGKNSACSKTVMAAPALGKSVPCQLSGRLARLLSGGPDSTTVGAVPCRQHRPA